MTHLDLITPPNIDFRMLWEALVDIAPTRALGTGPLGERRIVPIIGGTFRGGPGLDSLEGVVLPGGADRQLVRPDGAKELDALYEMEVADGTVLTIRNRVIIDETVPGPRYALSRIEVTAPEGPWAWLSRRLIVGTLQTARPEREAVIVRGFEVSII
ncbi:DUF3237 family protein [Rhodobacterales bacterium HKCCE2091]|nr:DUF3237 family protein [Rhodobacterales bacterium HKCCE2091]